MNCPGCTTTRHSRRIEAVQNRLYTQVRGACGRRTRTWEVANPVGHLFECGPLADGILPLHHSVRVSVEQEPSSSTGTYGEYPADSQGVETNTVLLGKTFKSQHRRRAVQVCSSVSRTWTDSHYSMRVLYGKGRPCKTPTLGLLVKKLFAGLGPRVSGQEISRTTRVCT